MARAYKYIIIIVFLFIIGCTTAGHRYIKIKPPSFGPQFIPAQINSLLTENGFNRIEFSARIRDLNARPADNLNMKTGMVLDASNKLLMRYQHQSYPELLVNVTIGKDKGESKLEFYENNRKELSTEGTKIYTQFKKDLKSKLYDENDFTEG